MRRKVTSDETMTEAVSSMVRSAENCEISSLPPIIDVIDPEALNDLFTAQSDQIGHVSFLYDNYWVTIDNTEYVAVEPIATDREGEDPQGHL